MIRNSKLQSYSVKNFVEQYGSKGSVKSFKAKLQESNLGEGTLFKEFFTGANITDMVPPAFLQQILTGALHNPIARKVAQIIPMEYGENIIIRRAKEDNEAQILAEGASADIDLTVFTKEQYEYQKIVKRPGWTYEALADYPIDLIGINNQLMGAMISAKEDQLFVAEMYKQTNTEFKNVITPTTPGTFVVDDLIEAIADVKGVKNFYKADTIIMPLKHYKTLLKDSDIRNAAFMGNSVVNDQGELVKYLGCDIYVADMVKAGPKGTYVSVDDIIVMDSTYATALIERQGVTIENWNLPERQMTNAMIYERVVPVVLQPEAIRRIKISA